MEKLGVPHFGDVFQVFADGFGDGATSAAHGAKQPLRRPFQGHITLRTGLKMGMFRNGRPAVRGIVEDHVVPQLPGQVQHVRIAVPDGLGGMDIPRNDQVVRKNRSPVDQNGIFASFASLEGKRMLVREIVLFTKRAAALRGLHPPGITLQGRQQAAQRQLTGLRRLQRPVFRSHGRPNRQLVMYEFVDVCCHRLQSYAIFQEKPTGVRAVVPGCGAVPARSWV